MSERFSRFSESVGLQAVTSVLQLDDMNTRLRNRLWNCFYQTLHLSITKSVYNQRAGTHQAVQDIAEATKALYRAI